MLRVFLFLAILTAQATACLWDRDTLAEEAKGRGDLVKILVGWFDRYPPRYYQMRLERISEELSANPNDLELLDDAAVASDRLGMHDEAIGWMEKKKALLDGLPADKTNKHRYRYLANLGTFYVHRWIAKPEAERNTDLSDLRTGEKLIAQAIQENPEAHFGREVYQLLAIRWLLQDGSQQTYIDEATGITSSATAWVAGEGYRPKSSELTNAHIEGISGLIQLGAAWQSADAFRSLAYALDSSQMASMAELAYLREAEIAEEAPPTIHPQPKVHERIGPSSAMNLDPSRRAAATSYFVEARAAADSRQSMWITYQEELFAKGMHPDTHPNFWDNWIEPNFPDIPGPSALARVKTFVINRFGLAVSIVIVTLALFTVLIADFIRRRKLRA